MVCSSYIWVSLGVCAVYHFTTQFCCKALLFSAPVCLQVGWGFPVWNSSLSKFGFQIYPLVIWCCWLVVWPVKSMPEQFQKNLLMVFLQAWIVTDIVVDLVPLEFTASAPTSTSRLQTGNFGIQDTVYFSTEISLSTYFQSAHRLNNVTAFIYTSSPSGSAH